MKGVLPQSVAIEMKQDIVTPLEGSLQKLYLQHHESVRFVSAYWLSKLGSFLSLQHLVC